MAKKTLLVESAIKVGKQGTTLQESTGRPGYIVESSDQGKLIVRLPVTVLDEKNENGRVYSRSIMESAMGRTKKSFESRELLSTADEHPEEPYPAPIRSSHIVVDSWCENDGYMWNRWEILETRNGQDLRALIESGASFGVSIRGLGSMDNFGNIMDDYEYLGTDCVGQPSARIRTAPVKVAENTAGNPASLNENTSVIQGNAPMNPFQNLDAAKKHLKEQITLARTENRMEAFKRIVRLDEALAASASSLDARAMGTLFQELDEFKESLFDEGNKTPLTEGKTVAASAADLQKQVETLQEQLKTVSGTFRAKVIEMAGKFREKEQASVAEAEKSVKALKQEKARARLAVRKFAEAKSRITKLEEAAILSAKRRKALARVFEARTAQYQVATSIAATERTKYVEACRIAARSVREAKKGNVPAVAKTVVESVKPSGARLVETGLTSAAPGKKTRRHVTEANLRGTTRIPGFI